MLITAQERNQPEPADPSTSGNPLCKQGQRSRSRALPPRSAQHVNSPGRRLSPRRPPRHLHGRPPQEGLKSLCLPSHTPSAELPGGGRLSPLRPCVRPGEGGSRSKAARSQISPDAGPDPGRALGPEVHCDRTRHDAQAQPKTASLRAGGSRSLHGRKQQRSHEPDSEGERGTTHSPRRRRLTMTKSPGQRRHSQRKGSSSKDVFIRHPSPHRGARPRTDAPEQSLEVAGISPKTPEHVGTDRPPPRRTLSGWGTRPGLAPRLQKH